MQLYSRLVYKLRKEHLDKAFIKFKKITIDTVQDLITKNCWEYGLQYEIMIKTPLTLEIAVIGRNKTHYLRFHKAPMIFKEDYIRFESLINNSSYDRGYYITNGVFEGCLEKMNHNGNFFRRGRIKLVDKGDFLVGQHWIKQSSFEAFKFKKLNFYKYLPY
ncbi:hypothetical protein [Clostridium polynesiense]|uniref:hypothetical protein n=1 Tax=Clostridium polynesiense TaxID=1325933 RepID=UPI000694B030|nr:hypothetical protein [Clostridium polynesiense]